MAIRLEKSGELYLIRGAPDGPETRKRMGHDLGLWLVLILLVMGVFLVPPEGLSWPAVNHVFRAVLGVVR